MEPNTMPPQGSVPPKQPAPAPSSSGSKGTAYTVGLVVGALIVAYFVYAYFTGGWPFA